MSEIDGVVELGDRKRGKRTVIVRALDANGAVIEEHEHSVPQGKHLRVHKGDEVRAGEPLVDGPLYPEDMLRINGEESVQGYLLNEVQNVYRSQSVTIDDKHIETILGQMMRKVQVNEPGDSEFLPGAVVDKYRFRRENERLRKDRRKPATGQTLLLGITKASLSSGLVHLGGLLPGDHQGAHRGRHRWQARLAGGPQGERDPRPHGPDGHRLP